MNTQEKINKIKEKNGIKTFGCCQADLAVFTVLELQELNQRGLISDVSYHKELMLREVY